ncbi:TIGR03826 family flagellar region protein [Halalkalibacter urbisdiaboli]|uniref:TIGR03826 family flagellar region protein n=1 Tax=Halalkalibacter urbisdiaboli TaxID=1960589 RepID=UPI000B44A30F|nr:TIGR03826 family flagellar region protein [Halalkalibacter urbisdiaboli]
MKDVANCPKCGGLFVKALRPICNHCFKIQEEHFEKVTTFMRKKQNRMATLREVHEQTEVPLEQIHQFVREGRLLTRQFPNLGYPCESCGSIIKEGRLCESCKGNITGGLEKIEREKERLEALEKEEKRQQHSAYHSLSDRVKK